MDKAKVFWSGGSQAVRMPKKYRFESSEISIRREGRAVVLEPLAQDWAWLDSLTGPLDDDFVEAIFEGR
ncbi:MAG: AbrB/MazE/SpoVT family DNA-binding domain-containing protein [Mesorhizobium sp.]|nr:MAG: AbrB/MazE/SpoVT family DNA-binding domain-containing protein [Mesorhizobium sp.]